MRILIVEDEPLLTGRLAATLGERGYVVDVAHPIETTCAWQRTAVGRLIG